MFSFVNLHLFNNLACFFIFARKLIKVLAEVNFNLLLCLGKKA